MTATTATTTQMTIPVSHKFAPGHEVPWRCTCGGSRNSAIHRPNAQTSRPEPHVFTRGRGEPWRCACGMSRNAVIHRAAPEPVR